MYPCFIFSWRRRHTGWTRDWSSDVCSSDLKKIKPAVNPKTGAAIRVGAERTRAALPKTPVGPVKVQDPMALRVKRRLNTRRKLQQFDRRKKLRQLRVSLYWRRRRLVSKKRWLNLRKRDSYWFENLSVARNGSVHRTDAED